ncbi:related to muconate cycloisomerase [Pseudozyma flocculosa]|uniref:Related to muconate cycloisomerase n=1 Tax=Pseudozyma flocculosa TaxID=84751 RepID=A0A5C3ERC5_9BASI|nr:related to muconate cycloisomerase [Pseudozyma flocculosa]
MSDPTASDFSQMGELRLHVWGSNLPSLPTLDPTCLYAASMLQHSFSLRRSDSAFQLKLVSALPSTPSVPLLEVVSPSGQVQVLDSIDAVRRFCVQEAGLDSAIEGLESTSASSADHAAKVARAVALHALLDDELLDITLHSLFSFPDNYRTVTFPAYASVGKRDPGRAAVSSYLTLNPSSSIPGRLRNLVEARLSNPAVGLWGVGGREGAAQRKEIDEMTRKANILPQGKKGLDEQMKDKVRDEYERGKLVNKAKQILDIFAAALDQDRWLLGSSAPTALDLHLYAYLDPLISCRPELPTDTIPVLLRQDYPTLVSHAVNVRQQLCPEGDRTMAPMWLSASEAARSGPGASGTSSSSWSLGSLFGFGATDNASKASVPLSSSPGTAAGSARSSDLRSKPSSSGKPALSREERRLRMGRAIWICTALLGLVGFTFATGIADDPSEDDDEEDNDEEDGDEDDEDDEGEDGWRVAGEDDDDEDDDDDELDEVAVVCKVGNVDVQLLSLLSPILCLCRLQDRGQCASSTPPGLAGASATSRWPEETTCPRVRHIVTGTFNTEALYVLGYDILDSSLRIEQRIDAEGPHQFLALGRTESGGKTIYATTWAKRKSLSAWSVVGGGAGSGGSGQVGLRHINTVDITATSSYVHVQPPPYASLTAPSYCLAPGPSRHLYSAGGPTGELHALDGATGAILDKRQEYVYLVGGEAALAGADKTRKALRYGAHNLDFGPHRLAYVADLGRNAILVYTYDDEEAGTLRLVEQVQSPREGDGPRHVVPSPDGHWFFSVTEHTSYVDVFRIRAGSLDGDARAGLQVEYVESLDILPPGRERHDFRGDTVRISPDGRALLASTRGMTASTRGFVTAWRLDLSSPTARSPIVDADRALDRYETRTSGGKANAIEWAPRYPLVRPDLGSAAEAEAEAGEGETKDLVILTDDLEGWVVVLEWDGSRLVEKADVKLPGRAEDGADEGASHAIWID